MAFALRSDDEVGTDLKTYGWYHGIPFARAGFVNKGLRRIIAQFHRTRPTSQFTHNLHIFFDVPYAFK